MSYPNHQMIVNLVPDSYYWTIEKICMISGLLTLILILGVLIWILKILIEKKDHR